MSRTSRAWVVGLWLLAGAARAAGPGGAEEVAQARTYFAAGAQAYAAGQFATAIRAFEMAYQLSPRAGILFSLGQAERRQYFVDRDLAHLQRAIDAFRRYLGGEEQGGRRAEAAEALSELEPLLARRTPSGAPGPAAPAGPAPATRLMVTSATEGAVVSLDGAPAREVPYIQDVEPGTHRVRVSAPGFAEEAREVPLGAGALVALDLTLREVPARLRLEAPAGASVWVDGRAVGTAPLAEPLLLAPGAHQLGLLKRGAVGYAERLEVGRGEEVSRQVSLSVSAQRVAAWVALGLGAASLAGGGTLAGLALRQQSQAQALLDQQRLGTLQPAGLERYAALKASRDQLRLGAGLALSAGALLGLGGLALWTFDSPSLPATAPGPVRVGVGPAGASVEGRF